MKELTWLKKWELVLACGKSDKAKICFMSCFSSEFYFDGLTIPRIFSRVFSPKMCLI